MPLMNWPSLVVAAIFACSFGGPAQAGMSPRAMTPPESNDAAGALDALANDFWQWRARYQPFSQDDITRIERPAGIRSWSAGSIDKQKSALADFARRLREIDATRWSVARQVDYRLVGSAISRVRWELGSDSPTLTL